MGQYYRTEHGGMLPVIPSPERETFIEDHKDKPGYSDENNLEYSKDIIRGDHAVPGRFCQLDFFIPDRFEFWYRSGGGI